MEVAEVKATRHLALIEEQNKQQTVFNSMVEGLLILDDKQRIVLANIAFSKTIG